MTNKITVIFKAKSYQEFELLHNGLVKLSHANIHFYLKENNNQYKLTLIFNTQKSMASAMKRIEVFKSNNENVLEIKDEIS